MYAYSNILAALIERGITGKGKRIDLSMLEATAEWMGFPLYYSYDGAPPPPRSGAAHATIYPYGPFPAGDGRTVMLGLQNEREWAAFCATVLRQPGLATDARFASNALRNARRVAERAALRALIVECFAALDSATLMERLDEARIANARVNTMHDLWQHPQLRARERWRDVDTPAGPIPALLPPGQEAGSRMDPIPAVGQHTDSILAGLGFGADRIAALREAKAV